MFERPRRNRKSPAIREMVKETSLSTAHLIYPLFIEDGNRIKEEITSLPGNFRWSVDMVLAEIEECMRMGLNSFVLFPKVKDEFKDKVGSYGIAPNNFYLKAAKSIKKRFPECTLISDVALDPYSSDGHDGLVMNGIIDNEQTLPILTEMALCQAEAGFDLLGPSDMMDGRVGAMRAALDDEGFEETGIMSYTAKYASGLYGPFRDALDSAPVDSEEVPKDKKTYQMDPSNQTEALREAYLDMSEGADFLMVKPALHYLDVISLLKTHLHLPIAAYHVSGECAMLVAAAQNGWLDYNQVMPETLLSIRRAGASAILTYFAKDFARLESTGQLRK